MAELESSIGNDVLYVAATNLSFLVVMKMAFMIDATNVLFEVKEFRKMIPEHETKRLSRDHLFVTDIETKSKTLRKLIQNRITRMPSYE